MGANLAAIHFAKTFRAIGQHRLLSSLSAISIYPILLLFQISDYIKVYYFMPFNMAHGQAKSNSRKSQRQPLEPKAEGEVLEFHILGV